MNMEVGIRPMEWWERSGFRSSLPLSLCHLPLLQLPHHHHRRLHHHHHHHHHHHPHHLHHSPRRRFTRVRSCWALRMPWLRCRFSQLLVLYYVLIWTNFWFPKCLPVPHLAFYFCVSRSNLRQPSRGRIPRGQSCTHPSPALPCTCSGYCSNTIRGGVWPTFLHSLSYFFSTTSLISFISSFLSSSKLIVKELLRKWRGSSYECYLL